MRGKTPSSLQVKGNVSLFQFHADRCDELWGPSKHLSGTVTDGGVTLNGSACDALAMAVVILWPLMENNVTSELILESLLHALLIR